MKKHLYRVALYLAALGMSAVILSLAFYGPPVAVKADEAPAVASGKAVAGFDGNCDQAHLSTTKWFNNVNNLKPILSAPNPSIRQSCTIDFRFGLTNKYIVITVVGNKPNYASYTVSKSAPTKLQIYLVLRPNSGSTRINVLVY